MTERERDELLTTATDRFERRMAAESGQSRAEIGEVRLEVGRLRVDMVTQVSETRLEVARTRLEMTEQFAASRVDAEVKHRDLLKWAVLVWIGQAASVAAIVSAFS